MQGLKNHTVIFRTTTGGVKVAHNVPAQSLEQAKEIVNRQIKVRKPFGNVWQGKRENNNFNE